MTTNTKAAVAAVAIASAALGAFAGAQFTSTEPTPRVATAQAAVAPTTSTTAAPVGTTLPPVESPAPEVRTQVVEVPVLPQACRDLAAFAAARVPVLVDQWNAWVVSHPAPTVDDYYQVATSLAGQAQQAAVEAAPLVAACLG